LPPLGVQEKPLDGEALVCELEGLWMDSVRLRMISDVPLGVLLSGGVDSSLIVAAAAAQSSRPVRTFTIAFPGEGGYDESPRARRIAASFDTEHHELEAGPSGPDLLQEMAQQFDEPLADSSLLPTFLVSRLTRGHVTVALGGDGGDEMFGGYSHYARAEKMAGQYGWVPSPFWRWGARGAARFPPGTRGRSYGVSLRGGPFQTAIYGTPYFDLALRRRVLQRETLLSLRDGLDLPERLKAGLWQGQGTGLDAMMRLDFETYLPDDILVKVDRASMKVALEVRAPWLDYRIAEFAFSRVPLEWKVREGTTRRLQRALARRLLPVGADLDRKQGFSIPLAQWMSGPWKPFIEPLLRGASAPGVDWCFALRLWQGQGRGRSNGGRLFALLMYELWWQAYGRRIGTG
jgi:asparagine synthase (glutamine-hydrolysing)